MRLAGEKTMKSDDEGPKIPLKNVEYHSDRWRNLEV